MDAAEPLTLSVIIPTRNRAAMLADLLDSLARQAPVDFSWEVLVVDNGSQDHTPQVVEERQKDFPVPLRRVEEPRPGLHHGRHRGARQARGRFLGYLDDDMILAPTWVQGLEMVLSGQAQVVTGRALPLWLATPPPWLLEMFSGGVLPHLSLLDLGQQPKPIRAKYVYGGNCFLPRELVFALGGFHPDALPKDKLAWRGDGEDALKRRLEEAGHAAWYDPRATAYHLVPPERMSVEYLCHRSFKNGISDSYTRLREPPPSSVRVFLHRPPPPRPLWRRCLGPIWHGLRRRVGLEPPAPPAKTTPQPWVSPEVREIRRRMYEAYQAGFRFHRQAVAQDPKLRAYVLQPHYWD